MPECTSVHTVRGVGFLSQKSPGKDSNTGLLNLLSRPQSHRVSPEQKELEKAVTTVPLKSTADSSGDIAQGTKKGITGPRTLALAGSKRTGPWALREPVDTAPEPLHTTVKMGVRRSKGRKPGKQGRIGKKRTRHRSWWQGQL